MKTKRIICLVIVLGAVFFGDQLGAAQESEGRNRPEPRFNASTRLSNGLRVAFASQTEPAGAIHFESSYIETEGSEGIHRVFIDKESGLFFGYDVKVEPVANTHQIKVSILPMSAGYAQQLRQRAAFQSRAVNPDFSSPSLFQTQAAHLLNEGDMLAVDALINQRTGVKIVEIIKASFEEIPLGGSSKRTASERARDFSLSDVEMTVINYRLRVNGEMIAGFGPNGGCSGAIMWFYLPERGRFVFSIRPHEGYEFQKTGLIEDNKISFTADGEQYEWISSSPILSRNGRFNLWVLHDPAFRPEDDESVASLTREGSRGGRIGSSANERPRPGLLMGAADRIEFLIKKK